MIKRFLVPVVFFLLCFPSLPVNAEGIPSEPSLYGINGWEPVTDRNVIVSFDDYEFKHHIMASPVPHAPCGQVQVKGREVWLLTPEMNPYLYIIQLEPNAYRRVGESDWKGTVGITSGWIKK